MELLFLRSSSSEFPLDLLNVSENYRNHPLCKKDVILLHLLENIWNIWKSLLMYDILSFM